MSRFEPQDTGEFFELMFFWLQLCAMFPVYQWFMHGDQGLAYLENVLLSMATSIEGWFYVALCFWVANFGLATFVWKYRSTHESL